MQIAKFHLAILCLLVIFLPTSIQAQWANQLPIKPQKTARITQKNLKVRSSANAAATHQKVAIIDKKVFMEGDIYLGEEAEVFNNGRSVVTNIAGLKWPNSTIPYTIEANHPAPNMIFAAINMVIRSTNLCLIPRTTETNYIEFTNGDLCFSQIGMHGGRQEVQASPGCGVGVMAHEILHAAGHFHEHARSDRDNYVKINTENVVPELLFNFEKATNSLNIGEYDYHSIMHYDPFEFSTSNLPTIELITPSANPPNFGQTVALSEGDVTGVNTVHTSTPTCGLIALAGNLNFKNEGTITVSGETVTLSNLIIENNGLTTVSSSSLEFLIVGSDGSFATIETLNIPTILAGTSYTIISKSWDIGEVAFVPNGRYTFGVWLNRNNAVAEATLRDNLHLWKVTSLTKSATTCPDLALSAVAVSSYSNNAISFNYQYKNIGTSIADVSGPTNSFFDNANIQAALSTDRIFDENDIQFPASVIYFNVSPNGFSTGSSSFANITVNTTTHPYLVIKIDGTDLVAECNEENNEIAVRIAPTSTNCIHPDFAALAAIYNATDGDNWTYNDNWNSSGQTSCDPCQDNWYGVECQNGRVTELHLEVNNLEGTIPPTIGNLSNLSILYLGGNKLSGCLPDEMSVFCDNATEVEIENNPNLAATNFADFCSNNTGNCNGGGVETPINDDCMDAIDLTVNTSCLGDTYSNVNATISSEEISFDCGVTGDLKDVWFTATIPTSGNLTVETYGVTNGLTDMVMQTYSGSCNNLIKLTCNDDIDFDNGLAHSRVVLSNQTPNTTIYIRVIAYNNADSGDFGICAYDNTPAETCAIPSNKRLTNISTNQATTNWDAVDHAISYDLQYKKVILSDWNTITGITTTNRAIAEVSSDFEWRVRTNCNNGSTSDWSSPIRFDFPNPSNCPDLSIAQLSINNYTTNSISFNYVYKNYGTVQANINYPNTKITAVISQDRFYDATDVVISSNPLFSSIPAGGIVSGATAVSNSNLNINTNTYPYFILEIDSDDYISECNEDNNTYVLRIDECSNANSMSLSNNLTNGFYTAQATINGNCVIDTGKDVQMQAANSITLSPGFHAKAGANLTISIGNACNNVNLGATEIAHAPTQSIDDFKENDWNKEALTMEIFPNPVRTTATLRYHQQQPSEVQLLVSNLTGQLLKQQVLKSNIGWHELNLDTSNYPSGTYLVSLLTPSQQVHEKIIVID